MFVQVPKILVNEVNAKERSQLVSLENGRKAQFLRDSFPVLSSARFGIVLFALCFLPLIAGLSGFRSGFW